MADFALPLREELLVAIDQLFIPSQPYLLAGGHRHAQIIRRIDDYITTDPPARSIATPSRRNAASRSGLRNRRQERARIEFAPLSAAQEALGGSLVADERPRRGDGDSYAMSNGFFHMGEFSSLYRSTFGESPSSTLARARQGASAAQPERPCAAIRARALELHVRPGRDDIHRPAIGIVGGVCDALIVEGDAGVCRRRVAVIGSRICSAFGFGN